MIISTNNPHEEKRSLGCGGGEEDVILQFLGHKTYNFVFKFTSPAINRRPHNRSLLLEQ